MVSLYMTVLFAHVIAALLLTGHSFFAPLMRQVLETTDSLPALRSTLALSKKAGAANPAISMLLLASGIYLGSSGWWYAGWFYVSVAMWVVNSVLAVSIVNRASVRLEQLVRRDAAGGRISFAAETVRRMRAWTLAERVILANDVSILFIMLSKPELTPSMAIVVAADLIAVALLVARRPRITPIVTATDQAIADAELAA